MEVDGAAFVTLEESMLVARAGGDENDGHLAGALAAAHELGELESVHLGHLHIEQGQSDIVNQQQLQRLAPGACREYLEIGSLQQRGQRQQVFLEIIDEQTLHRVLH